MKTITQIASYLWSTGMLTKEQARKLVAEGYVKEKDFPGLVEPRNITMDAAKAARLKARFRMCNMIMKYDGAQERLSGIKSIARPFVPCKYEHGHHEHKETNQPLRRKYRRKKALEKFFQANIVMVWSGFRCKSCGIESITRYTVSSQTDYENLWRSRYHRDHCDCKKIK